MAIGFKNIYGIGKNTIGFISSGSIGSAPVNTVAPVISGTITIGQTLSCTEGTWTGTAPIVYTYQWFRDAGAIGGATNSTYVLTENELNRTITCVVTGTNSFGASSAASNGLFTAFMISTILGANYTFDWNPAISGSLTLTGSAVDSIASVGLSANPFVQTGAARPQLVTNQINGKPVIRFDGATSWMDVATSTALFNFLHNTQGGTVIIIFKNDLSVATRLLNNRGTAAIETASGVQVAISSSLEVLTAIFNNQVNGRVMTTLTSINTVINNNFQSFISIFDAVNATLNQRGTISVDAGANINNNTDNATLSNTNAAYNMTLGRRVRSNDQYIDGDVARIIISDTKLTPTQQSEMKAYLEFEYGMFPIP
jgi:hypothetical protein